MNILVLAAGRRSDGAPDAAYPLWLSEIDGSLVIERQIGAMSRLEASKFVFMFQRDDVEAYFLKDIIEQLTPNGVVLRVSQATAGAACTALLAAGEIDRDQELVVTTVNDQIDVDYCSVVTRFRRRGADAGVLTFASLHPRYSYVRTDAEGWVVESAEKRPISRSANAGFFWFKKASDFFDAVRDMILKDDHVKGVFYIAPALNQLVLRQKKIWAIELLPELYHPLKSEREIGAFETATLGNELHHASSPA